MNEGDTDKRQVGVRLQLELVKKVVNEFGREADGGEISPAIIRALEEATRDTVLSPSDYADIAFEASANMKKRMDNRKKRK